jgi:hypothetical protein
MLLNRDLIRQSPSCPPCEVTATRPRPRSIEGIPAMRTSTLRPGHGHARRRCLTGTPCLRRRPLRRLHQGWSRGGGEPRSLLHPRRSWLVLVDRAGRALDHDQRPRASVHPGCRNRRQLATPGSSKAVSAAVQVRAASAANLSLATTPSATSTARRARGSAPRQRTIRCTHRSRPPRSCAMATTITPGSTALGPIWVRALGSPTTGQAASP